MSNKAEAPKAANVVVEFFSDLAKDIMAKLKLDDNGKLNKFLAGEVKTMKNGIKAIEMNKQTAALQHDMALSEIDSQIEDAKEALHDSYRAVTIEDINTNEAMKSFSKKYWENIEAKERAVKSLTDHRSKVIEAYEKLLAERNENIAKQEARIAAIS